MVSGRRTLSEIERSLADLGRQEQQLLKDVEALNAHHVSLLEQRTAAFRDLADVRTRSAVADGVIDRADALQHQVESLLKARQTTVDALKARDAAAKAERDELSRRAETHRDEVARLESRLDDAAEQARAELAGEARYQGLATERDAAQHTLAEALEKTRQAERDRRAKGAAYEGDPLFMYLWERKYGSADYRPHWLVRMGDDWVARLVGWSQARANYAILNEIPDRLREHAERLTRDAASAAEAVEAAEAERIERIAGTDLLGDLADARMAQAETVKGLESIEAELVEIARQLTQYAEGLDESFQEAVRLSASFLEQESYQRLIMLARRTAEPADDRIVDRIGEIDRKTDDLKRTIAQRRKDLDHVAKRRRETIEVAARFRRNHYDDPGSEFELDDIVEDVLEGLVKGAISGAEYWARSQRRHSWKGRPADPFRKQAGFPPFGWGGGGGRKRGGGGGGFRTGGGF